MLQKYLLKIHPLLTFLEQSARNRKKDCYLFPSAKVRLFLPLHLVTTHSKFVQNETILIPTFCF